MRRLVLITCLTAAAAVYGQQLTEKIDVNLVNVGLTADHGDLIQNATLRLKKGIAHTIVVDVHDQVTDSVGVAEQRIEF